MTAAVKIGTPKQAGTRYNNAGCGCLKTTITIIVAASPNRYAANPA